LFGGDACFLDQALNNAFPLLGFAWIIGHLKSLRR
jgi:hypothetical protein